MRQWRTTAGVWGLIGATMLGLLLPQQSLAATPEQVDQTIAKGKAFLYSQQTPEGTWEIDFAKPEGDGKANRNRGGETALATYALLAAGESYQEPRLQKAIEFLKKVDMVGTYAIGLRAQVWLHLPRTPEIKDLIA